MRKPGDEEELTIEVQSVQSGEKLRFDSLEAALAFLRDQAKGILMLACP
jgi:hypothetical protein